MRPESSDSTHTSVSRASDPPLLSESERRTEPLTEPLTGGDSLPVDQRCTHFIHIQFKSVKTFTKLVKNDFIILYLNSVFQIRPEFINSIASGFRAKQRRLRLRSRLRQTITHWRLMRKKCWFEWYKWRRIGQPLVWWRDEWRSASVSARMRYGWVLWQSIANWWRVGTDCLKCFSKQVYITN